MTRLLCANIRFLTEDEGGYSHPLKSGIKPQIRIKDMRTSCIVHTGNDEDFFVPGNYQDALIEVIFWSEYSHLFASNMKVELYEGNRLIALGELLE